MHVDEGSLEDEGVEESGAVGEGEVAHVEGGEGEQGGVQGHLPRLVVEEDGEEVDEVPGS